MDEKVKAEYNDILASIVIERGELVKIDPDKYMWEDPDSYCDNPHLTECQVRAHGDPVESEWMEFEGTFAEPETQKYHGVDLPGVWCVCGELEDRTIRLEATVTDLTSEMFARLYERMTDQRGIQAGDGNIQTNQFGA